MTTWLEFADKHAEGLAVLAMFALIAVGLTLSSVADAFARRGKR